MLWFMDVDTTISIFIIKTCEKVKKYVKKC